MDLAYNHLLPPTFPPVQPVVALIFSPHTQLDAEKVAGFEEYKGHCQPVFLFYKVGAFVVWCRRAVQEFRGC